MSTWNGIGTKFYGYTDQYSDGSFITTKWFTVFFMPIIPLGSFRVTFLSTKYNWTKITTEYKIIKKISLNFEQVIFTYFLTIIPFFVAYWMFEITNNHFPEKPECSILISLSIFALLIILASLFYLTPKPTIYPSKKVPEASKPDISKVTKPQITPPLIRSAPDISPLEPLIKKYEPAFSKLIDNPLYSKSAEWISIKNALDDVILLNFQSISFFMENEVYRHNTENKKLLEDQVKIATAIAASCSWMIGKEWGENDPELKAKFRYKENIEINDIPFDAMELIAKAVYFPYYTFAKIFTEYYDSPYGNNLKRQRDGHLADTYQSMMKGMLVCFLIGIKS